MDDYSVQEFQNGRDPRFQVTVKVSPIAGDGSHQLQLTKCLIRSGVIPKVGGVEFQIIDDEIRVVFMSKSSPSRFNIEPRLQDYQALLTATISKALELNRFFAAFEMMKGQAKIR